MKKVFTCLFCVLALASLGFSQFTFKFKAGMAWIDGNDYNSIITGQMNYADDVKNPGTSVQGSFEKLKSGTNFQGELIFDVTPSFGLGLGAGYFKAGKESTVKLDTTFWLLWIPLLWNVENTYTPKLSVIPIFLNLHYYLPVASILNIDFYGGPGYYLTSFDFTNDWEWGIAGLFPQAGTETFKASKGTIGFQGGIGLEVELAAGFGLFLDICGQYAKISELKGDWTDKQVGFFNNWSKSGSGYYFWYYDWQVGGKKYAWGAFAEDKPSDPSFSGVRKAAINLTGYSLSGGIKINF